MSSLLSIRLITKHWDQRKCDYESRDVYVLTEFMKIISYINTAHPPSTIKHCVMWTDFPKELLATQV